jgi:predicted DsbA family dithiol-disulfide isomerase
MHPLSDQAWIALNDIFANVNANGAAYEAATSLPSDQRFVAIGQAAGLVDFFAARGLSSEQAQTCLADGANVEAIASRSQQQAQEMEVNSTPTFFLNGRKLEVNQWPGLEPILQRAGAR